MPSILFVCTANICRSPMAKALFQRKLEQMGEAEGWRVESAGTWAAEGEPAVGRARKLLSEDGLDLSSHRSRSVSHGLLRSFDLILTMERGHKEALQVEFPDLADRVYLLKEMVGSMENVEDPVGGSNEDYLKTIQELTRIFDVGYDKICRLAHKRPE